MAGPDRNELVGRLRRLPGQFLLALVNATAILAIIAAILVLVAIGRINHFAGNLAATTTEAVLSKVNLPPREALANLRNLTEEIRALREALAEIRATETPRIQAEVTRLREAVATLNTSVDRLRDAGSALTAEAIGQLARAVGDALVKWRSCPIDEERKRSRGADPFATLASLAPAELDFGRARP
jgi:hypothetical protein